MNHKENSLTYIKTKTKFEQIYSKLSVSQKFKAEVKAQ